MTDNQRKAIDELTKYREAQKDIKHHQQRLEAIEAKINRSTRACHSIMQETFQDGKFVAVPVVVQANGCGNSIEDLMAVLMDQRATYMQKQVEAEQLCFRIQVKIWKLSDSVHSSILDYIYLHDKSLVWIAAKIDYSLRQTKRKKWEALDEYGKLLVRI